MILMELDMNEQTIYKVALNFLVRPKARKGLRVGSIMEKIKIKQCHLNGYESITMIFH